MGHRYNHDAQGLVPPMPVNSKPYFASNQHEHHRDGPRFMRRRHYPFPFKQQHSKNCLESRRRWGEGSDDALVTVNVAAALPVADRQSANVHRHCLHERWRGGVQLVTLPLVEALYKADT